MKEERFVKAAELTGGSSLAPRWGEGEPWSEAFKVTNLAFVQSHDQGRIGSLLDRLVPAGGAFLQSDRLALGWRDLQGIGLEVAGQGRSSICLRLPGQGSRSMDLAVKIMLRNPAGERSRVLLRHWETDLRTLQRPPAVCLVPPMRLTQRDQVWALIMPFGELGSRTPRGEGARMLELLQRQMADDLAGRGLVLGDVPQVRWWRGIPFVIDYFDLTAVA